MRRRLLDRAERGATAVEYALLVAGVAAVLALPVHGMVKGLDEMFEHTCEKASPMGAADPSCHD